MARLIYVIDTCVLLSDPSAIFKFADHDLYLPLAVIDDLDEIKTRREPAGWAAREVFRILDEYNLADMMTKGAPINEKGGKLFIYNHEALPQKGDKPNISRTHSDNAIINSALSLKELFSRRQVIVVTQDAALRVRASIWGCKAENYQSATDGDEDFTGIRYVEVTSPADWQFLWRDAKCDPKAFSATLQESLGELFPHEFIVFTYGDTKCPTIYQHGMINVLKDKSNGGEKVCFMGVSPKNLEQKCAMTVLADDDIPLVTLCGAAGTGKTLLALSVALEKVDMGIYDRIIVIKPLIPVGGKDIGALPGDKYEKIGAWLGPMRDNIAQLVSEKGADKRAASSSFEEMVEAGLIEVEAMVYIQGRSICNSFIVIDECQNLTPREARMAVERVGKGSKIVLLGDLSQVEHTTLNKRSNGLAHAINGSKAVEVAAVVTLTKVERSALAAAASKIFARPEAQR